MKDFFVSLSRVLRNVFVVMLGLFLAGIATSGVHALFGFILDPIPMGKLATAEWAERVQIISQYMDANPLAIYSALLAHSLGAFVGTWFAVWSFHSFNKRGSMRGYRWSAAVIIGGLWLAADLQNDLIDAPVGPMWTAIDVVLTLVATALGYALGGGFSKRALADLTTEEDEVYKG
ncbi:MAG: hypothetical protein RL754_668 [Bacteroidota bacterium]|jgi:hypothetical protein